MSQEGQKTQILFIISSVAEGNCRPLRHPPESDQARRTATQEVRGTAHFGYVSSNQWFELTRTVA
jgi:hypothetical protein